MKNLKIGILGTRGIPNHYGGFEQFAEHLSAGLVERGHEVIVYNSSLHPYQEKNWNGVNIVHCKDWEDKIGTAGQFIYDLNCINDARKRNFDVLLHLGYTSDSIWYWRWPKNTINVVNMDGLEWQRSKYNKHTQKFLKKAEALAAKHAHTMIADSPGIQDYLFKTYGRKPVYIPYGADSFLQPDPAVLIKYKLVAHQYFLLIARMEPGNNIEMIIKGYLDSGHQYPLFIIGNITNKFGQYLIETYKYPRIIFNDAIYDQSELDSLRHYCTMYFHGHSVGGTNPSLLEAMACNCLIVANNNQFNNAVLSSEAHYFSDSLDITEIINAPMQAASIDNWKKLNVRKIEMIYNQDKITDAYENLMLNACEIKKVVIKPVVAKAV